MLALALALAPGRSAAGDTPHTGDTPHDGRLRQLRFSWDGKYVLAQDDTEITVLSAAPLAVLFRIPAENATLGQFTPDSREIAFVSSIKSPDPAVLKVMHGMPHVERWSVCEQARIASVALAVKTYGAAALTLDARTLAYADYDGTLGAIDVATGRTIMERKKFNTPAFVFVRQQWFDIPNDLGFAKLAFSPDGRFLIAIPSNGKTVIWDIRGKSRVSISGLMHVVWSGYGDCAFLAPNRVLISSHGKWGKKSIVTARIVDFPDGKEISKAKIPWAPDLQAATDSAFLVVLHPYWWEFVPYDIGQIHVKHPSDGAAAIELSTGKMITTNTPAIDVFGNHYLAEPNPGEIGCYERGKGLQTRIAIRGK